MSKIDQFKDLTQIREKYEDYKHLPANLSRWTLANLDKAMKAFFRRCCEGAEKPGFPRYKGKGRIRSFGFSEWSGLSFENNRIKFKGMPSTLRVDMHRPLPKNVVIKSCIFSLKCDKWHITFQLEIPDVELEKELKDPQHLCEAKCDIKRTAYDLGREKAVTFHDEKSLETVRIEERYRAKTKKAQRAVSRSQLGSKSRRKKVITLGRITHKQANARKTHCHQLSAKIVNEYDVIGIDNLKVKQMTKSAKGAVYKPGKGVKRRV